MALPEELAFFLLLAGTAPLALFLGLLALGPREAVMDGAAILELDLALLNLGLLDLEFGESRPRRAYQPGESPCETRKTQRQALRAAP